MIKYFFECYFSQTFYFEDLDYLIQDFKKSENEDYYLQFVQELHQIIQTNNYALASRLMKKYGDRILNVEKTEKFINFLYDRLIDKPTDTQASDFSGKTKFIFCPVCCPEPEKITTTFSILEKATIIQNEQQIHICKPCKLVWLTEDIRADNAQNYKKFMKTLGLKGLRKELRDIEGW